MLTLEDAAKVAKRLVIDGMSDDEIIRQELEQKCWFPSNADKAPRHLNDLIFDINPAEICTHIQKDNLKEWCVFMQTEMKMAMVQLPSWAREDTDD